MFSARTARGPFAKDFMDFVNEENMMDTIRRTPYCDQRRRRTQMQFGKLIAFRDDVFGSDECCDRFLQNL